MPSSRRNRSPPTARWSDILTWPFRLRVCPGFRPRPRRWRAWAALTASPKMPPLEWEEKERRKERELLRWYGRCNGTQWGMGKGRYIKYVLMGCGSWFAGMELSFIARYDGQTQLTSKYRWFTWQRNGKQAKSSIKKSFLVYWFIDTSCLMMGEPFRVLLALVFKVWAYFFFVRCLYVSEL